MAFTQITSTNIKSNTVVDYATYATLSGGLAPKITTVNVANSAFTVLDDTAVNVGGGYIVVTGENFATGATVLIDTVQASAVTRVSSTTLQVQLPAKSAATYNLYVVNPDGGTGIRVNGVTYSSEPTWTTSSPLTEQASNTAFNITLSATGASSYAVAAGSSIPPGTTLAANGYFYGTVSIGAQTTYTFSVVATDAENQDSSKTFQVTVTVIPQYQMLSWGRNAFGSLGQNDVIDRSSPTQIGTSTWDKIGSGYGGMFAGKADGTLWAWGWNFAGHLGLNDTAQKSSPTQVGSGTDWAYVSKAGSAVVGAIKTNGTLWMWGYNYSDLYLGGITGYRSNPVQLGSGTDWLKVYSGYSSVAIKTDGTLWAWGNNPDGGLGNNTTNNSQSPIQIGATTNWANVGQASSSKIALKTDGTLWAWGNNANGKLGLNNTVNRSSPTQVGTDNTWSDVVGNTVASTSFLALKSNGTLWAWGNNGAGQLGLNDTADKSSPTQIGTDTNWSKIFRGGATSGDSFAIKTDGTLWAWGGGNGGQLGHNNLIYKSSPTQVGSATGWSDITGSNFGIIALKS